MIYIARIKDDNELSHYGVKRRSGRYPWGSGKEPYQHSGDFLARVEALQKEGFSEKDIAQTLGMSTTELRLQKRLAKHERHRIEAEKAQSMREDGKTLREIADALGYANDSSVRALLNEEVSTRMGKAEEVADILRARLNDTGMLDVGAGVEQELGVSRQKLEEALRILENEGYSVYGIQVPQVTNPKQKTTVEVLSTSDFTQRDAYQHPEQIQSVVDYEGDGVNIPVKKLQYPASLDGKRVFIRYAEDGGIDKDGVIELRPGLDDLNLGASSYAQVRIMVDNDHYMKGMAMYGNDIPDGYDVVFNTNKSQGTPMMKVLKEIKDDPDNPFGAAIKEKGQYYYIDENGQQQLSPINKLKEEGDWDRMSKNLSSQFLAKQPVSLISKQLDLTYDDAIAEYDEINSLTNPTIKRKLLEDFAGECESAAVTFKAKAFPRQSTQVILPINEVPDTEVYAPNYKNGEKVALVRYPHAGRFEIPILTVNNNIKEARDILPPTSKDAVGINSKVANILSGADFDGDQVVVIPVNSKVNVRNAKPLEGLKNFDPKREYSLESKIAPLKDAGYSDAQIKKELKKQGISLMGEKEKQTKMGVVSNLITDMTLQGAPAEDLERAVRHSMVVIDAVKHKLDYKRSERENGIDELKRLYQKNVQEDGTIKYGGASTLLSKRKTDIQVPETKGSGRIDKETGKVVYKESGRTYVDEKGKTVKATKSAKLLLETDDLHKLSSGTTQEGLYADFGNKMKALADQARKASVNTPRLAYSKTAAKDYSTEVESLSSKLKIAQSNAPRERRAQAIANSVVKAKVEANPSMEKSDIKKLRQREIVSARAKTNASGKDTRISVTDKEWDAIQKGAISDSMLSNILRYSDADDIRKRATPRAATTVSPSIEARIKRMADMGYTNSEIADKFNVSTSTVSNIANGSND